MKRFALAVRPDQTALQDALERVLFRVASIPQDERARQLGVRASRYRARTGAAESMLRGWLERAANQFLAALAADRPVEP